MDAREFSFVKASVNLEVPVFSRISPGVSSEELADLGSDENDNGHSCPDRQAKVVSGPDFVMIPSSENSILS